MKTMKTKKTSFLRKSVYAFTCMALAVGVSSCDGDDDAKKVVDLPEVAIEHSISGVVTAISGDPIEGVLVALSGAEQASAITNGEGVYTFEGLEKPGSYQVEFAADGKVGSTSGVVIADIDESQAIIASTRLANEVVETTVSTTEETVVVTETETAFGNEDAATSVTTTVPAGAVEDNKEVVIVVQPVYDAFSSTRTVERVVVDQFNADIKLSTGEPYVLPAPFKVTGRFTAPIDGQCFVRVVYADGSPSDSYTFPTGIFSVRYDRSCTIYVEADATITVTGGYEPLMVTPTGGIIDRLNASRAATVDVTYNFKMGAELTGRGKAREILEKYVAVANGTVVLQGTLQSNFEVPEGAKYIFTASQHYSNYNVDFDSKEANGKKYEDVATSYHVEVPFHNGGGN